MSVVLHLMLKMSRSLMSGMPNNANPFSVTTKNLGCLFLQFVCTLHVPNCAIFVSLYVFKTLYLSDLS